MIAGEVIVNVMQVLQKWRAAVSGKDSCKFKQRACINSSDAEMGKVDAFKVIVIKSCQKVGRYVLFETCRSDTHHYVARNSTRIIGGCL